EQLAPEAAVDLDVEDVSRARDPTAADQQREALRAEERRDLRQPGRTHIRTLCRCRPAPWGRSTGADRVGWTAPGWTSGRSDRRESGCRDGVKNARAFPRAASTC